MSYRLVDAPPDMITELEGRYRQLTTRVSSFRIPNPPGQDTAALWERVRELDSKVVGRFSSIFKRHLGVSIEPKMIKNRGYDSCDEFLHHLVPRMLAHAAKKKGWKPEMIV